MSKLTVVDIFCGAGGFSEGFRQAGFDIIMGIDKWESAIKTYNFNFNLNLKPQDVLQFEKSIEAIEQIPDSDIIIGSPPCVTFSSSNISGKADKTSGITLTQIFLKIVAVKKWKAKSKLKAWYMENVPSSIKHLGNEYTFEELGLAEWAKKNKIGKSKIALKLSENQKIINAADYGSPQTRERVISGEIIAKKCLIIPPKTHSDTLFNSTIKKWKTLRFIMDGLPEPFCDFSKRKIFDPNYPTLSIDLNQLTDHFYDTGLYECEWRQSKFFKTNHPYMGKMAFPENSNKPSRTITATKIGTSREALIYKSEYKREGDGQYRTPTVREAACIMGFPISYQFLGGETVKWRLVGNAVCPSVAYAFAKQTLSELGYKTEIPKVKELNLSTDVNNLNTFLKKEFKNPPRRNKGSRFRRHPFKDGNLTVTLSNYDIDKNGHSGTVWITSTQYGNGRGFFSYNFSNNFYKKIEPYISQLPEGKRFINQFRNGLSNKIAQAKELQEMYEFQKSKKGFLEPTKLIERVAEIIENLKIEREIFYQKGFVVFKNREKVPLTQLYALYAINKICSAINKSI